MRDGIHVLKEYVSDLSAEKLQPSFTDGLVFEASLLSGDCFFVKNGIGEQGLTFLFFDGPR
jgi:hypothetical protein